MKYSLFSGHRSAIYNARLFNGIIVMFTSQEFNYYVLNLTLKILFNFDSMYYNPHAINYLPLKN